MNDPKTTETKSEPEIPFEDEKGMFGTSPIAKELDDEDVEYLTSRTAPRIVLTRSRAKIALYINLFLILFFLVRLVYFRTAPVTGFVVPPVLGLGETGLAAVCAGLSILNLFLVRPEDKTVVWMARILGTGVPLALVAALYLLPPERIHRLAHFLF
ncbi:hypothetical protein [Oleispirillum naphthae]|uniref:hypothetical protein n=1 Tax=Oleispirillum naphthae TaxID=2838853 RepID=UPI0030826BEC